MNHANFAETTLAAAITTTDGTSITVTSETSFPSVPFIISIGTEVLAVMTVDTVTWTVTRGYEGSTAATHLNGAAIFHDISAAEADSIATKFPLAGGTLTGNLVMDNMDIQLVKLLTLHGEIDDGNSGAADTIDWSSGAAHKSTLTGNVTLAFTGYTYLVPVMTANALPTPLVASNSVSGADAWNMYNRNDSGYDNDIPVAGGWEKLDVGNGNTITPIAYRMYYANAAWLSSAWKIQACDDNVTWVDMDSRTGQSFTGERLFTIAVPAPHRYWRLLSSAGANSMNLGELDYLNGFTNPTAPCFLTLKLVQDGTGGRTVAWPATVKGTPAINLAINATSNILFYWDGTYYWTLNGIPYGAVEGPTSATDNAIVRFDAATGKLVQDSNVTIDDAGYVCIGTPVALSGASRLSIASTTVKTSSVDRVLSFRSSEVLASNPLELEFDQIGSATSALQAIGLRVGHSGMDFAANLIFQQDGGGNVGIGTTAPLSKLSINGGLHVGGDSDAGDNNLLVDGTLTVGASLVSAAGLALIDDANAAAQLTTLGTAAYSEGTWTPSIAGFTVIGSAPVVTGAYKRIGNLVFITIVMAIGSGGNTSVASVAGTSGITSFAVTPASAFVGVIVDNNVQDLGNGLGSSSYLLFPTFAAQTTPIYITAVYNA